MFSKACEYGIRAAIYIAEQSQENRRVSLKAIAKAVDSPLAFTSKVLQQLSRNNIINSEKGPKGGFFMDNQKLEDVKISNIVFAIDGDDIYSGCGLGLKKCNDKKPCPVHDKFVEIRNKLRIMLETTSIKGLSMDYADGLTFLKR